MKRSLMAVIKLLFSIMVQVIHSFDASLNNTERMRYGNIKWMLDKTPALFNYIALIITAIYFISACSLNQISNHIIMSLDILFFLGCLFLISHHNLKLSKTSSLKV